MNENIPDASEFRQRITREDDLLNKRTTVFLVTSGLLMTAVGISDDLVFGLIISMLGTIVTIFWVILSWQNWNVIKQLTIEYRKHHSENYIENIVQRAMFKPGWRRPTDLIARPIPFIFLIAWISLLVFNIVEF